QEDQEPENEQHRGEEQVAALVDAYVEKAEGVEDVVPHAHEGEDDHQGHDDDDDHHRPQTAQLDAREHDHQQDDGEEQYAQVLAARDVQVRFALRIAEVARRMEVLVVGSEQNRLTDNGINLLATLRLGPGDGDLDDLLVLDRNMHLGVGRHDRQALPAHVGNQGEDKAHAPHRPPIEKGRMPDDDELALCGFGWGWRRYGRHGEF